MQALVLASGSQYRAELLARLNQPFDQFSPDIDESPLESESPQELATRLAENKAKAPSLQAFLATLPHPACIIASDQVAALGSQLIGKPGTFERASKQLCEMSGKTVAFYTSLHLYKPSTGETYCALDTTTATLRSLSEEEIDRYLKADQPLDCAGSFKVESLGISLFDSVKSNDPTALVGLPMIELCKGLRSFGFKLP